MGLLDDLAQPVPKRRFSCGVKNWLDSLPADEAEGFNNALGNERYTSSRLHEVAKKNGLDVNADRLRAHRNGRCSCGRSTD